MSISGREINWPSRSIYALLEVLDGNRGSPTSQRVHLFIHPLSVRAFISVDLPAFVYHTMPTVWAFMRLRFPLLYSYFAIMIDFSFVLRSISRRCLRMISVFVSPIPLLEVHPPPPCLSISIPYQIYGVTCAWGEASCIWSFFQAF